MRSPRRSSKSGLFLMELMIAITFFAVASAVCIQMFAKAHTLSRSSSELSMAVAVAQTGAESFKAAPHEARSLAELAGAVEEEYYDKSWQPLAAGSAWAYKTVLAYSVQEGKLLTADIRVYAARGGAEELLFEIPAKKYVP